MLLALYATTLGLSVRLAVADMLQRLGDDNGYMYDIAGCRNGKWQRARCIDSRSGEACSGLLLQSPAIAIAIARDCYILVVLFFFIFFYFYFFYFFFRPPNFAVPGPIFTKLYHTTRYVLK